MQKRYAILANTENPSCIVTSVKPFWDDSRGKHVFDTKSKLYLVNSSIFEFLSGMKAPQADIEIVEFEVKDTEG